MWAMLVNTKQSPSSTQCAQQPSAYYWQILWQVTLFSISITLIIIKTGNTPKHAAIDEWINCGTSVQWMLLSNKAEQIIDKSNNLMMDDKWWIMNLKGTLLMERSQSQKATYCKFPFIWCSWNNKTTVTKNRSWSTMIGDGRIFCLQWSSTEEFWRDNKTLPKPDYVGDAIGLYVY